MAPIWEKRAKNDHHYHWSSLPRLFLSLTNPQHHLSVTTYSPLQELQFELPSSICSQAQLSSLICLGDISRTMAPIWEKRAKKVTTDQVRSISTSDASPASSGYNYQFPSSRASIWSQAQLSNLICLGDISRTMAPIWEKKGKKDHHHHWSGLPHFSLFLTDPQHHLSITTFSLLRELQFECKHRFLAQFVMEIITKLAEPWHQFGKKGKKGHHHHRSDLPCFTLTLTNPQRHLSISTDSSLQELPFKQKSSFLAQFFQEILAEPWYKFEIKGSKGHHHHR